MFSPDERVAMPEFPEGGKGAGPTSGARFRQLSLCLSGEEESVGGGPGGAGEAKESLVAVVREEGG